MPDRDPRTDPRPGDELRGDPWRYRVLWHARGVVRYEMIHLRPEWLEEWAVRSSHSVSLSGWRDMAAGLTVERVA